MTDEQKASLVLSYRSINQANGQLMQLSTILTYAQYQGLHRELTTVATELEKLMGTQVEHNESDNSNVDFNPFKITSDGMDSYQSSDANQNSDANDTILRNNLNTSSAPSVNPSVQSLSSDSVNAFMNDFMDDDDDDDDENEIVNPSDLDSNDSNSQFSNRETNDSSSADNSTSDDSSVSNDASMVSQSTSQEANVESSTVSTLSNDSSSSSSTSVGFSDTESVVNTSFKKPSDPELNLPTDDDTNNLTSDSNNHTDDSADTNNTKSNKQTSDVPSFDQRVNFLKQPVSTQVLALRKLLIDGDVAPSEIKGPNYEFSASDIGVMKDFNEFTSKTNFAELGDNKDTHSMLSLFDNTAKGDYPLDIENYNCNRCLADWLAHNNDSDIAKRVAELSSTFDNAHDSATSNDTEAANTSTNNETSTNDNGASLFGND